MNCLRTFAALLIMLSIGTAAVSAQEKTTVKPHPKAVRMVAYDAKDKRYYSVAWAKAHGMRDRGGDKLILIPMSRLPKEARMSKAMRGRM